LLPALAAGVRSFCCRQPWCLLQSSAVMFSVPQFGHSESQAHARRTIEEGAQRRAGIEAVIAQLVARRDEVLAELDRLGDRLDEAITAHRPPKGGRDPFAPVEGNGAPATRAES
jgi:hypothetical protein